MRRAAAPSSPRAIAAAIRSNIDAREKLGGRVPPLERRHVVQVAVVQRRRAPRASAFAGPADVDDDAVGVERGTAELHVDDVGGAVEALGRPEHLAGESCAQS